jgi:hypothetical protein
MRITCAILSLWVLLASSSVAESIERSVEDLVLQVRQGESLRIDHADILEQFQGADGEPRMDQFLVTEGRHGFVDLKDGHILYTPIEGFIGTARLQFSVADNEGSLIATIYVRVEPADFNLNSQPERTDHENEN